MTRAGGQLRDILFSGPQHSRHSFSHVTHSVTPTTPEGDMDATFLWKIVKMGRINTNKLRGDDDLIDRLNYHFSSLLLFLFIGLVGIRQYIGKPFECWIPQEFTRGWEEYAENYCWLSNTYFSPVERNLPAPKERKETLIGYYQWAPIVLGLQAIFFYLPCVIWRLFMNYSCFNVQRITRIAHECSIGMVQCGPSIVDTHQKTIRFISRYIDSCIQRHWQVQSAQHQQPHQHHDMDYADLQRHPHTANSFPFHSSTSSRCPGCCCCCRSTRGGTTSHSHRQCKCCCSFMKCLSCLSCGWCNRRSGNFLVGLYLFVKILYLLNLLGQLWLMEVFIDTKYTFYGVQVLWDLLHGKDWNHSGHFPRVTFCDFEAKKLGKNHKYSLQCVLPMNMLLEKIFIFLWFWHVCLTFMTFMSFCSWMARIALPYWRLKFIRKYLKIMQVIDKSDKGVAQQFTWNYLRADGVFLLQLLANNCGDILAGDVTCQLWHMYRFRHTNHIPMEGGPHSLPTFTQNVANVLSSTIERKSAMCNSINENTFSHRNPTNHDEDVV